MSRVVHLLAVGGFSDKLASDIDALPAISVDETMAGARLVALKHKFNELQERRESFHKRQGATGIGAVVTGGLMLLAGGAGAVRQQNLIKKVIAEMETCIEQINAIRAAYSGLPGWAAVEAQCTLNQTAFKKKVIDRISLHGSL